MIALLASLAWLAIDLARPVAAQWSTRGLLMAINLYQATLSPWMPTMGVHCRFTPTCSHYGEGAIAEYGALVGSAKTAWRVLRCGPWSPEGTYDPPVPDKAALPSGQSPAPESPPAVEPSPAADP